MSTESSVLLSSSQQLSPLPHVDSVCRTPWPLVLAGLVLGVLQLFTPPELTKELLYAVFLPGLLSEAASHLEFREFWRERTAIALLLFAAPAHPRTTIALSGT